MNVPRCLVFLCLTLLPFTAHSQEPCAGEAVFIGGLSTDGGNTFVDSASSQAAVTLEGTVCPRPEHAGQLAELYAAVELDGTLYLVVDTSGTLRAFDASELTPFREAQPLSGPIDIQLFSGVPGPGIDQVSLFVAYRIGDDFHMDDTPVRFNLEPSAPPAVTALSPAAHQIAAAADATLRISFDKAIDPGSVQNGDLKVFGRWSGVASGELSLSEDGMQLRFVSDRPLAAGEQVSATLAADSIRAADGVSLPRGYTWSWWVGTTPAVLDFQQSAVVSTRQAGSTARIQTYGAYAGDLDGDGWSDLVVPNEISDDLRIFLNDGSGHYDDFTIVPVDKGSRPSTNEGADFNGDGAIDFVVGSATGQYAHVFFGNGNGGLTQTQNLLVGNRVRGVCLADAENDGDVDILATAFEGNRAVLYLNDGNGEFSFGTTLQGGNGEWSCATGDMNNDGLTDLVIGSRNSNEFTVYLSNGDGSFTHAGTQPAAGDPWMIVTGDINRDGTLDLAAVNAGGRSLTITFGDGDGQLQNPASYSLEHNARGFPLAVDLGDLDGDGDLDVVTSDYETRLFLIHENDGSGLLNRLPDQLIAPEAASCAILHDRDNDGDLDISGIDEKADVLLLYRH